jgi:hypothetical protein
LSSENLLGPWSRWHTTIGTHFLAMTGAAAQAKGESHEAYSKNFKRSRRTGRIIISYFW